MYIKNKCMSKVITILLVTVLIGGTLVGCTKGVQNENKTVESSEKNETKNSTNAIEEETTFPLKETVKLTYWAPMQSQVSRTASNYSEIPLYQEIMKRTNIELEFLHPSIGEEKTVFSLMIASGKYPDIIEGANSLYQGGAVAALADNVIVPLNDLIDKYCPNYKRMIEKYEDIGRLTTDDDGNYLGFPWLLSNEELVVNWGLAGRKDLFERIGEPIPKTWTIDDMYQILKKFKDETDVKWPFTLTFGGGGSIKAKEANSFLGAWDITYNYYVDNGTVKYGMAESAYKDFLTTLKQWYKEGIYDNDFLTTITNIDWESRAYVGEFGVHGAWIGAIEKMISQTKKTVPEYDLIPLPAPTLKDGGKNRMMGALDNVQGITVSFSSQNKHLKESAMLLDYGYGDEGSLLYSVGIEGESFDILDNGNFKIRDEIFENEYNVAMTDMFSRYARAMAPSPYYVNPKLYAAYWYLPVCEEALKTWTVYTDSYLENNPIVRGVASREENSSIADEATEIKTYTDEMFARFITGQDSLEKFDEYIEVLNKMGLQHVISVKQAHHDRYMKGNN